MGTQIGPSIPLNDLTLYLDASINTSYPGYGSIWYDISGKGNNFTLFNTPTHDGEKFIFNGINEYAQCVNSTCGNFGASSFAIEYLVTYSKPVADTYDGFITKRSKQTAAGAAGFPGWNDRIGSGSLSQASRFCVQDDNPGAGTDDQDAIYLNYNRPVLNSTFHTVVNVVKNTANETTASYYINGNLNVTDFATLGGDGSVNNSQQIRLMLTYGEQRYMSGSLYFVRIWNRALTPSEVGTNWDIVRNKYGL